MTKNIYLSIELTRDFEGDADLLAKLLAQDMVKEVSGVKSVQFRYGAFAKVDKVFKEDAK